MPDPFVLLDDARNTGAAPSRLLTAPVEIIVARQPHEVEPALARIAQLVKAGHTMAGYLAYEAGLALEPRLTPLLAGKVSAAGPLVWFGAFAQCETIAPQDVPARLAALAGSTDAPAIGPLEPETGLGAYEQAFAGIHEAIHAGDIYQANLTMALAGTWRGDPLALYAAIRPAARAGYGGVIFDGSHWLLSFSPELFFTLRGRTVRTKPMKGTRPRGKTPAEDEKLREDLALSAKDRAENLMIVDLLRNDLSRVAVPGSVRVDAPFAIETFPTVHQMVSTIEARLSPGLGAMDTLRALFPCGSITGAPKIRAMELIDAAEHAPRGPYCGTMGWIEPTGDAAFNVAIRTLRLTCDASGAGGTAVLGVGGAVVADSEMLAEWRECLVKGGFVRESAGATSPARFDLIETMKFTPDDGIPLLELHLARIGASADALGFAFDRHAVRNAIQALCFDAERPSKLRLVSARSGTYALELADLPPALPDPATVAVLRLPVDSRDWRLTHKTSDRAFYAQGLAMAQQEGAHEALFLRDDGLVTEGSFTNLFVSRDDGMLLTPPAGLGLLPGVLRRWLIDNGKAIEAELTLDDLANGFLIGNALRGLVPARLLT